MKNTLTVDAAVFLNLPVIDTSLALEVNDVTAQTVEPVKQRLKKLYGDISVTADGKTVDLNKLKPSAVVYVKPLVDFDKPRYNVADAMRVISRLTQDEGGCPWDKAQTHESIRVNMIEEAYEAVDAIDKHDVANMREEFGDVFLQSILQSDIARRSGEFDFDDVCDELCKKLIGRHTFIFGNDSATTADEALVLWDKAKAIEKNYDSVKSQLARLPDNFPSLLLCQKTYRKIKKAGGNVDPKSDLQKAIDCGDYVRVIAACAALLADGGASAEVELNKLIKSAVEKL